MGSLILRDAVSDMVVVCAASTVVVVVDVVVAAAVVVVCWFFSLLGAVELAVGLCDVADAAVVDDISPEPIGSPSWHAWPHRPCCRPSCGHPWAREIGENMALLWETTRFC